MNDARRARAFDATEDAAFKGGDEMDELDPEELVELTDEIEATDVIEVEDAVGIIGTLSIDVDEWPSKSSWDCVMGYREPREPCRGNK